MHFVLDSKTVLKSDINNLYKQGDIKNKFVYNTLKFQAELAEKASLSGQQPMRNKLAVLALKAFQYELKKVKGKYLTEDVYQILYYDAEVLIEKLQSN